ncbi:MAG: hypothetical protein LBN12_08740 [Clostridiales Family XIII bacterium]|nr:hypothetical protein [Clostridiales Family XIII bacterium]
MDEEVGGEESWIPACAGMTGARAVDEEVGCEESWIPAFAGMTGGHCLGFADHVGE